MSVTFFGPFLDALWKKKRHGYFMQDSVTAHIANHSFTIVQQDAKIQYHSFTV
jgi:hypothetical protein